VALAECCMADREAPLGADVDLAHWGALPLRALLFGEAQGRVVLSTPVPERVLAVAASHAVPARVIGRVRDAAAPLSIAVGGRTLVAPLPRLETAYHDAIPRRMEHSAAAVAVVNEPFTPVP